MWGLFVHHTIDHIQLMAMCHVCVCVKDMLFGLLLLLGSDTVEIVILKKVLVNLNRAYWKGF